MTTTMPRILLTSSRFDAVRVVCQRPTMADGFCDTLSLIKRTSCVKNGLPLLCRIHEFIITTDAEEGAQNQLLLIIFSHPSAGTCVAPVVAFEYEWESLAGRRVNI